MGTTSSVGFFDSQFREQVRKCEFALNPFEQATLEHLRGTVLDYGCGLGNLSIAAAERGCDVTALDASEAATGRLAREAADRSLPIRVLRADLRSYRLEGEFDCVVCIGLLMFFDCATAFAQLEALKGAVRPGGILVLNVLVRGTTYLDMFEPSGHCLFDDAEVLGRLADWTILSARRQDFPAPHDTVKAFLTLAARRPGRA